MGRTSSKRRDLKGRVLGEGEYQKPDGKYEYRYRDKFGELRSVYSWRLTASDATPAGKRNCEPLRDMAAKINRALSNNIDVFTSSRATLNERFDLYISGKINLKPSTRENYTIIPICTIPMCATRWGG